MKIAVSYPPLESTKGVALLSQNRQFQWFNNPTFIYPMVPASAATLLQSLGHEVVWDDAIAEQKSEAEWLRWFAGAGLDLIALESKTPTIKKHWRLIAKMKELSPSTLVVLMGDHVTGFPEESLEQSPVDFVLTGGDFDFGLRDLVAHLDGGAPAGPGTYYRADGGIVHTRRFLAAERSERAAVRRSRPDEVEAVRVQERELQVSARHVHDVRARLLVGSLHVLLVDRHVPGPEVSDAHGRSPRSKKSTCSSTSTASARSSTTPARCRSARG